MHGVGGQRRETCYALLSIWICLSVYDINLRGTGSSGVELSSSLRRGCIWSRVSISERAKRHKKVDSGKYIHSGMVWGSVHHSHNAVGFRPMVANDKHAPARAQLQRRV